MSVNHFTDEQVMALKGVGFNAGTITIAAELEVDFDYLLSIRTNIPDDKWKGIGFGGSKEENNATIYIL